MLTGKNTSFFSPISKILRQTISCLKQNIIFLMEWYRIHHHISVVWYIFYIFLPKELQFMIHKVRIPKSIHGIWNLFVKILLQRSNARCKGLFRLKHPFFTSTYQFLLILQGPTQILPCTFDCGSFILIFSVQTKFWWLCTTKTISSYASTYLFTYFSL